MAALIDDVTDRAGTHVLVIGVSAYKHFEGGLAPSTRGKRFKMRQLTAAARSASDFAAWMRTSYRNPRAELASLRVLLSPSDGEVIAPVIADLIATKGLDSSATLANARTDLASFRAICDRRADNVAVVYVTGHGVQLSKHGAIVLLHDCGDDLHLTELEGAIDVAGVHAGFDHPTTAQTQFWFLDACRQEPAMAERYEVMQAGLTLDTKPGQAETNPLFMASATQMVAYARTQGRTLFNEALMAGLAGGFAAGPDPRISSSWHIAVNEFTTRLRKDVEALAQAENVEQIVTQDGNPQTAVFHTFEVTPSADVEVFVTPPSMAAVSSGTLSHRMTGTLLQANGQWPMQGRVVAGTYELSVATNDPTKAFFDYVTVEPAKFTHKVSFP